MRRLGTLIALVCAAGALLVPAAAQASHAQSLTFEATSDLKDPATRDQAFKDVAALGVHSMRVVLYWHDVAPEPDSRVKPKFDETDPASYNWGAYDPVIDGIKARGWQLLLTVSGPVPRWATNGARDTLTRPSPAEFQKFVHAVATHYGAKVDTWSVWNEPNQPQFLGPQLSPAKTPLSPRIYRNLYFAAQRGLRNAGFGSRISTTGRRSPRSSGPRPRGSTTSVASARSAACRTSTTSCSSARACRATRWRATARRARPTSSSARASPGSRCISTSRSPSRA